VNPNIIHKNPKNFHELPIMNYETVWIFVVVVGVWTQGFVLARQAIYHLSHASSHASIPEL
jgi:hypothetical protein